MKIISTIILLCLFLISLQVSADQSTELKDTKLAYMKPLFKCSNLVSKNLTAMVGSGTTINSAFEIEEYCVVSGTIEPSINFQVKLPLKNWSQRYVQLGCARLCGIIFLRTPEATESCFPAKNNELVVAANNLGHNSSNIRDSIWARDPKLRVDFAHRANHITSVAVKALIKIYYGQAPKFSYFIGCSSGGREGLIEAQRYPKDFDGVISGSNAINFITQNSFYHAWNTLINIDANGMPILTTMKLPILHQAVLNKCDELDGVKDGVINTPWLCDFDPDTLLCKKDEFQFRCLSSEEIRVIKEIYSGANDGKGNKFVIHGPLLGSENLWPVQVIPTPKEPSKGREISTGVIRDVLYEDLLPLDYSINDFKFTKENFEKTTKLHSLYDGTSPHINEFVARGGKILLWHGLGDADISPYNTIAFYTALEKVYGAEETRKFAKLYVLPGAGHCGKGFGPSNLELLTAMIDWVENQKAPFRLIATLKEGTKNPANNYPPKPEKFLKIDRTRPVFPYPISTEYSGKGDMDDEINFKQGKELPVPEKDLMWMGSSFFK